jgi:hypothetical protein
MLANQSSERQGNHNFWDRGTKSIGVIDLRGYLWQIHCKHLSIHLFHWIGIKKQIGQRRWHGYQW